MAASFFCGLKSFLSTFKDFISSYKQSSLKKILEWFFYVLALSKPTSHVFIKKALKRLAKNAPTSRFKLV